MAEENADRSESISFEQRSQEAMHEACKQEAPKVREQIDMAVAMQIIEMGYKEMVKNNPSYTVECGACHQKKSLTIMHQCGRCMKVFYCGEECQRNDWSIHKQTCKT